MMDILQNNLGHTNLDYIEMAKIQLSSQDIIKQRFEFLSDCPEFTTRVSEFINAIKNNVEKIVVAMNACLSQASIRNTDIDLIILRMMSILMQIVKAICNHKASGSCQIAIIVNINVNITFLSF